MVTVWVRMASTIHCGELDIYHFRGIPQQFCQTPRDHYRGPDLMYTEMIAARFLVMSGSVVISNTIRFS